MSCKKMILGAGNLLLSDEGVGIHVLERIRDEGVPEDVELFDCGTASWYAMPLMEEVEKLVIVDAVSGGISREPYIR